MFFWFQHEKHILLQINSNGLCEYKMAIGKWEQIKWCNVIFGVANNECLKFSCGKLNQNLLNLNNAVNPCYEMKQLWKLVQEFKNPSTSILKTCTMTFEHRRVLCVVDYTWIAVWITRWMHRIVPANYFNNHKTRAAHKLIAFAYFLFEIFFYQSNSIVLNDLTN